MPLGLRRIIVAACLAVAAGWPAPGWTQPVEWIVENGNTLVLRLVIEDGGKPCGGELLVDPNRRTLTFEGAAGDIGCTRFLEADFDELEELRVQRDTAGFLLDVGEDETDALVLLPLPHFRWLAPKKQARPRSLNPWSNIHQGLTTGPISLGDGGAHSGRADDTYSPQLAPPRGAAPASPGSPEGVNLPPDVSADIAKAVELIRAAMGRSPAPTEVLWEALYGRPVDTTVMDLVEAPGRFASQPVRVRARLLGEGPNSQPLRLEAEGVTLSLAAEPDREALFAEAASTWAGQQVEVIGRVRRRPANPSAKSGSASEHYLSGWKCVGPDTMPTVEAMAVTLGELFERPDDFDRQPVRVVGCFRGRNARGDLPSKSQRSPLHWIIKSDQYAIWVTGRRPEGDGWALDLTSPRRSQWLEVVGRLRWRKGFGYLEADEVRPVAPPPGGRVRPARRVRVMTSTPDAPAEVVFTLPLEYEPLDPRGRIILQFDRSMDEDSFTDHVRLRYAGQRDQEGDLATRLAYDDSRRALLISPVRPLVAGMRIEVLLLAGIVDFEGDPLGPRSGVPVSTEVVDVLAYDVRGSRPGPVGSPLASTALSR